MRLFVTLIIIVAVVFGLYNLTMATYGWFQVSNLVDEIARPEASKMASSQGGSASYDHQARFTRIREALVKGSKEIGVELRPEGVNVGIVDGLLDVKLNWEAPIVAFQGKTYVEFPMSVQRGFLIKAQ